MRVAIYARVSTQIQVESQTIDQQITQLQEYVAAQDWLLEPDHIYRDEAYSGATLARPGLDCLRDRAALFEFDVVVITAPDRLARNYVHQMLVIQELEQRHIQVAFLERPMSDDPHDRLLLQIRGAVAEYERILISDRMRRGRLMKYRAGKLLPWGRPAYGYGLDQEHPRDPEHVWVDKVEAAVIVEIFNWYLQPDTTLYRIARRLTDLGVPTPHGKARWHTSTVRNILTNTAYIGTVYANRYQRQPAKKRHSPLKKRGSGMTAVERDKEEWIPIPVPAIVDKELFERVQEKLERNRRLASRNNTRHQYLLRGLVSCGLCRLGAYGRTANGKYHYYVCRGHSNTLQFAREERCTARFIPAQQLDDLVWEDLCDILLQPEMITNALVRAHGGYWLPQELQARLKTLTNAISGNERQQKRLLDAYLAEIIDLAEFERKHGELDKRGRALQVEKARLETTVTERMELSVVADSIETFCQQVLPMLKQTSFAQKRQLVELLVDRVVVIDEAVDIRYVIPTRPDGPHVPFCHLHADYQSICGGPKDNLPGAHAGTGDGQPTPIG